jgi:hypothetical protein
LKWEVDRTCSESNPIANFAVGGFNSLCFTIRELGCVHACEDGDEAWNIVLLKFFNIWPFFLKLPDFHL